MAGQTDNVDERAALLKEGLRLLEAGDVDTAIANFTRVIAAEPGRAAAYRLRGSAHLRKRAYGAATADLDQAIKLAPIDAATRYLRGRARYLTGDMAGAIADYDQAIELKPDYLKAIQAREVAGSAATTAGGTNIIEAPAQKLKDSTERRYDLIAVAVAVVLGISAFLAMSPSLPGVATVGHGNDRALQSVDERGQQPQTLAPIPQVKTKQPVLPAQDDVVATRKPGTIPQVSQLEKLPEFGRFVLVVANVTPGGAVGVPGIVIHRLSNW
jgi:tetratricopeptide (TPR) repeat protein